MPVAQYRVGVICVAHFLVVSVYAIPMTAYSSEEDRRERLATIIFKNTKEILKEIDRAKSSSEPSAPRKKREPVNAAPKDVNKGAVRI